MTINFDMDGVLAKYLFEKPYEALFEERYFLDLPPQENFLKAAKELSKKHNVYILSAYLEDSKYALNEKKEWLKKFLPEIPESNWKLIPCGTPKGNYLDSSEDILIDDYGANCKSWQNAGGIYVKVSTDGTDYKNEKKIHKNVIHPFMDVDEIISVVEGCGGNV